MDAPNIPTITHHYIMLRHSAISLKRGLSTQFRHFHSTIFNQEKIGFIGLGNMGHSMAKHLIKSTENHEVIVFDVNKDAYKIVESEVEGRKFKVANDVSEVAKNSNVVITMLPNPKIVRNVYNEMLPNSRKGQLYIDASTIDPQTAQEVNKILGERGILMIDAPVSGGVGGAAAGTLTFMLGGTSEAIEKSTPILKLMGKNLVTCGGSGMGQVAKICNNLVLGISMSGVSEAMALGTHLGMDPVVLAQIFNTSTARCWSSDTYNPCPGVIPTAPSSRGYTGGFASDLMMKDIGLAIDAASNSKVPVPLGKTTLDLYREISKNGHGGKDFSVVFQYHKDRIGKN